MAGRADVIQETWVNYHVGKAEYIGDAAAVI